MKEEKEILSKSEQLINIIYYVFRYSLYLLAFGFLAYIIGEFFSLLLVGVFWFLSQLHMEYKTKIQKSTIVQKNCEHEELLKKINTNKENI